MIFIFNVTNPLQDAHAIRLPILTPGVSSQILIGHPSTHPLQKYITISIILAARMTYGNTADFNTRSGGLGGMQKQENGISTSLS